MAPGAAARRAAVDARTDVYALGCVLYELLAGEPPFVRDTDIATLFAHLSEPPPSSAGRSTTSSSARWRRTRPRGSSRPATSAAPRWRRRGHDRVTAPAAPAVAVRAVAAAPLGRRARAAVAVLAAGGAALAPSCTGGGGLQVDAANRPRRHPLHGHGVRRPDLDRARRRAAARRARPSAPARVTQTAELGAHPSATAATGGQPVGRRLSARSRRTARARSFRSTRAPADGRRDRDDRALRAGRRRRVAVDLGRVGFHPADRPAERRGRRADPVRPAVRHRARGPPRLGGGQRRTASSSRSTRAPGSAPAARSASARGPWARPAAGAIWVVTEPGRLVRAVPDSERTTAVAIGPPDPLRRSPRAPAACGWSTAPARSSSPTRHGPPTRSVAKVGGELLDVEPEGDGAWVMDAGGGGTGRALRVAG